MEIKAGPHHRRLERFRHGFLMVRLYDGFLLGGSGSELYGALAKYVAKSDSLDSASGNLPHLLRICSIHVHGRIAKNTDTRLMASFPAQSG